MLGANDDVANDDGMAQGRDPLKDARLGLDHHRVVGHGREQAHAARSTRARSTVRKPYQ